MMELRRFDESDQPAVIRLRHAALGPTGAYPGPGPWDEDLERIGEVYLQRGGEFLVATMMASSSAVICALSAPWRRWS
jgi:hypothetical protein